MEKERINLIAQLLSSMKDLVEKLEEAYKKNDMEMLASMKKEILKFQAEIKRLI